MRSSVRLPRSAHVAAAVSVAVGVAVATVAITDHRSTPRPSSAVETAASVRSAQAPAQAAPVRRVAAPPRPAWVGVPAATVWWHTTDVRRVDRRAVAAHPSISGWLRAQSLEQQRALDERVMTQAVLGEQVHVLGTKGSWSRVRVDDQRGSAYPLGIIGWVPTVQLRWTPPRRPAYPPAVRHPTGAAAVAVARGFLGVPYLWGGMTRSGVDCSGLTYLVFRRMGLTLARDASDQASAGRAVARSRLQPGDLVFFGPGGRGTIHHVGVYVGGGNVLHAPRAGTRVMVTPLSAWTDYWGARRLLPTG